LKVNVSIYQILLVILILICLGVFTGVCFFNKRDKQLDIEHSHSMDLIKASKDSVIKSQYRKIHELEGTLTNIDLVLSEYEKKLDSLSIKKAKVKIIYKDKYVQIQTLSDTAIVSYWTKEFRNE